MTNNKGEIMRGVFTVLKVVGIISIAVLAPNALQIFGQRYKSTRKFNGYRLTRTIRNMERKGLIKILYKSDGTLIKLTRKGTKKSLGLDVKNLTIVRQKNWDRKWRLVIFDIPERLKQNRKIFQQRLRELGFVMLQKSVWVCPYPCIEQINLLKEAYGVTTFVNLITAEKSDIKKSLIKRFNLL